MNEPRLERLPQVIARTGLPRSTVYARIAEGTFPRPIPLGTPHAVAFVSCEVDAWIAQQIAAARREPAGV